jgi:hypothetical protein
MKKVEFWKTFNLCKELAISGTFIYNGLRVFDSMESFYYEEEVFEFLYNIAVGIERLEKICIILAEHDTCENQKMFEKSLITHSHQELLHRIEKIRKIGLSTNHYSFIKLLNEFYTTYRYDRFNLNDAGNYDKEKQALILFLNQYYNAAIEDNPPFEISPNSRKLKANIGKCIGKIVENMYQFIIDESTRLHIYTYEIRPYTKAYKIFLSKEYDFYKESVFWKELLIFSVKHKKGNPIIDIMKSVKALPFDSNMLNQYYSAYSDDTKKIQYLTEVDTYYENIEDKKGRLEILDLIGNTDISFDE